MTDKDLKRIYEYMGWTWHNVTSKTGEVSTCSCGQSGMMVYEVCHKENQQKLDSNLAWECVQEMEKRNDWEMFYFNTHNLCDEATRLNHAQFQLWLMNPANFFNCFAKFLEVKHES